MTGPDAAAHEARIINHATFSAVKYPNPPTIRDFYRSGWNPVNNQFENLSGPVSPQWLLERPCCPLSFAEKH